MIKGYPPLTTIAKVSHLLSTEVNLLETGVQVALSQPLIADQIGLIGVIPRTGAFAGEMQ